MDKLLFKKWLSSRQIKDSDLRQKMSYPCLIWQSTSLEQMMIQKPTFTDDFRKNMFQEHFKMSTNNLSFIKLAAK